jgi:putative transposase
MALSPPVSISGELTIYHRQYSTGDEATGDIFEFIEAVYHRLRRHSTLGYDSPAEFEARTAVA